MSKTPRGTKGEMKRLSSSASSSSSTAEAESKRRKVKYETYKHWVSEYDRECQTASWLECEAEISAGKRYVTKLKCWICRKYNSSIIGQRNYSDKWIEGAESVRATNIRDHSKSDQHVHAMNLYKRDMTKASGKSTVSYAPIARALNVLPEEEQAMLRYKFDVAYVVATEQLAFKKFPKLCELESRHGVKLGVLYRNEKACKEFIHFIAESGRQQLNAMISNAHFFSLLMDSSTDSSNHDN